MVTFSVVVEGSTDETAVRALVEACGHSVGRVHGGRGRDYIQKKITSYNQAASLGSPWFVLVDLDRDPCASGMINEWLPGKDENLTLRVAVRMLEAWLMADLERFSTFLGVPRSRLPVDPDSLPNPKQAVIELARRSRKSDVRKGIPPKEGSGAKTGPTYATDMSSYAEESWRPDVAATNSPSLERCLRRLRELD